MLAYVYVQLKGFANAAKCFEKLSHLEPEEFIHNLNRAQCLALANQPSESLAVLEQLCTVSPSVLGAHLARAKLLTDLGRPQRAFAILHEVRDEFWARPEYVALYMSVAHAANQERRAHEGFEQLWKLRNEGIAPEEVLQPKTFDDLVKFGEAARERSRLLQDQVLGGKIPWLLVEQMLNNVPYWGWRVRTQPLAWLLDDPYHRASFAIYATNSFAVLTSEDGQNELNRISASEQGQPAVVDLSALITLHRLGLLSAALEYFGAIKIPPSYLADVLRHSGKLLPHQLSQKHVLEQIRNAIDRGTVTIATGEVAAAKRVDEYEDELDATYRIRNVLDTLSGAGKLSQQQLDAALRVAHKVPIGDDRCAPLAPTDTILVDLLTLRTLAGVELLDIVCETFSRVALSSEDRRRLDQELRDFALGYETHAWHEDLWRTLGEDDRVDATKALFHIAEADVDSDNGGTDEVTVLDSALLAQQEHLPLLVDDRVCQNMVLRIQGASSRAAFGTDCLLSRLRDAGLIDEPTACRSLLRLIEWRYRFLLLSEEDLRIIAQHGAPADLRKVARYVHDCMRDPGLFVGPEPTSPPIPLAFRLYQDWLRAIAHFSAELWLDESLSAERASELTRWARSELVPTVPRGLGAAIGRIADFSAFTVLHFAMLRLCQSADYAKANTGLRTMATALGLSDQAFIQLAADAINSHDD
jgi:tetratricopeptide (TPR) repeat protein